ncbi:Protein of unknown function [Thiohalospira halophila DSM 15071]|uniref:Glutaredoxin n=1 Tax=Thiohalospira halophila DSM 15071 TaxID=1123397 RepID=A0A1I1VTR9_9GAMM|nr:DUF3429 family protein [Thiohalospira halophila]SFD84443.1 Protein of unknown function [Thiohalospira halophila DSM 15071]
MTESTNADGDGDLRDTFNAHQVVVFRSGLTDTRELAAWLERLGVDHTFVDMPMGEAEQRERFRHLQQHTGWHGLPMAFYQGEFVGGEPELRRVLTSAEGRRSHWLASLGYGGLVPFVAATAALAIWPGNAFATTALVGYAAVILAFLGAVHWGRVLAHPERADAPQLLQWGVIPALLAWVALLTPPPVALGLLLGLVALVHVVDRHLLAADPAMVAYRRLRRHLSWAVLALLALAWALVLVAG